MQIVTSWMRDGMLQEARTLVLRQLNRKLGSLPDPERLQIEALTTPQLETLAEDLLDFNSLSDLQAWLTQQ
uniref:DUF4351 domain-containing protein n=1 Tax=Cyanothece sp. (strain PCC 7425 / ATCC 29141) TaxID=395961 RepID=B8HZ02_CYAP4